VTSLCISNNLSAKFGPLRRVTKFIIQISAADLLEFVTQYYRRIFSIVLIHLKLHKFNFTCKATTHVPLSGVNGRTLLNFQYI